ncbi:MAG: hypothetical protein BWY88_00114 [Synergistetes bacterium ADurb.Bin520]|nr:MAG: hypothetical protein BWY88_00114 [Synergistetes bacterium ADurb.Bin520]
MANRVDVFRVYPRSCRKKRDTTMVRGMEMATTKVERTL